jgi:probable phosphoglycerate mutase
MCSAKTSIFLVRHGETEWNQQNRLQGNLNSPLTIAGIQQANDVKKMLDQYEIHQAYVSPLKRARETVSIILDDRKLDPIILDGLREISLGPWEGKTREEAALSHPDEYCNFWEKPETFGLSGAETFRQLQHRIVETLELIFSKGAGNNILVVSHWIAIKVALAHYMSTPLSLLANITDPRNGAFIRLTRQGNNVSIRQ